MKAFLAVVTSVLVASCVSAPLGPPMVSGAEPRGLPLDTTELVVVYVSNRWAALRQAAADEAGRSNRRSVEPPRDLEALRKALASGFSSVKPDARIAFADDRLIAACFASGGLVERNPWNEPLRPDLDAPACREVLAAEGIRYLVSVHGWLVTDSSTEFDLLPIISVVVTEEIHYRFEVATAVFDATRGQRVCGDGGWQDAEGRRDAGVGIAGYGLMIPFVLGWIETVDARAYWEHAAWQAGARTATCFVAPEGPAVFPEVAAGQIKRALPVLDPYAWPSGSTPPIFVRSAPLEFVQPHFDRPKAHDGRIDCSAHWDSSIASSASKLKKELEEVGAAPRVAGALRTSLADDTVVVELAARPSTAPSGVAKPQVAGASVTAPTAIVVDVQTRFGQLNRVKCLVKLVASVEVRVQPAGKPESPAPSFNVSSAVDDVPVESWSRNPAVGRESLDRLLTKVAADVAAGYRERTFGSP